MIKHTELNVTCHTLVGLIKFHNSVSIISLHADRIKFYGPSQCTVCGQQELPFIYLLAISVLYNAMDKVSDVLHHPFQFLENCNPVAADDDNDEVNDNNQNFTLTNIVARLLFLLVYITLHIHSTIFTLNEKFPHICSHLLQMQDLEKKHTGYKMHVSFFPKTFRTPGFLNNVHCLELYQSFQNTVLKCFLVQ
jgi:hypothetical protein